MPSDKKPSLDSARRVRPYGVRPYTAKYNLRSTAKIFPFLNLPGEIRNLIYSIVLKSRDEILFFTCKHSLFRTCKQIRTEGLPRDFLVFLRDRCSSFPRPSRSPVPNPTLSATDQIQNLHIIINCGRSTGEPHETDNPYLLEYFRGNNITRASCTVTLAFQRAGNMPVTFPPLQSLKKLTSFNRLRIRLVFNPFDLPFETRVSREERDREVAVECLSEALGPADTYELEKYYQYEYDP